MYGILPLDNDLHSPSFQVTLRGFVKDVITQLRRDLTGYWAAHPDFVRLGLALLAAYRKFQAGDEGPLFALTRALFTDAYRAEVDAFLRGHDIAGLDPADPGYVRSLWSPISNSPILSPITTRTKSVIMSFRYCNI